MSILYDILGWNDLPTEEKAAMSRDMWNNKTGKYIAYYKSLEGSAIGFTDIIEVAKDQWCAGYAIFENGDGLTFDKLKEIFPEPPAQGVVLAFFEANYKEIHRTAMLITEKHN